MDRGNMDELGAFLVGKKKLFRVTCRRPKEVLSKEELERYWDCPTAYVASTSIENASLKAVQFFNNKEGVNDFEIREVSVYASADGDGSIFID